MKNGEKEQLTLNLPTELREALQREAAKQGYTITDEILFILWEYFEKAIPPE